MHSRWCFHRKCYRVVVGERQDCSLECSQLLHLPHASSWTSHQLVQKCLLLNDGTSKCQKVIGMPACYSALVLYEERVHMRRFCLYSHYDAMHAYFICFPTVLFRSHPDGGCWCRHPSLFSVIMCVHVQPMLCPLQVLCS
jgi:hypothetical protein